MAKSQASLWKRIEDDISWSVPYALDKECTVHQAPKNHRQLIEQFENTVKHEPWQNMVYEAVEARKKSSQKTKLYNFVISTVQLLSFFSSPQCCKTTEQKTQILEFWIHMDDATLEGVTKLIQKDYTWIYAANFLEYVRRQASSTREDGSERRKKPKTRSKHNASEDRAASHMQSEMQQVRHKSSEAPHGLQKRTVDSQQVLKEIVQQRDRMRGPSETSHVGQMVAIIEKKLQGAFRNGKWNEKIEKKLEKIYQNYRMDDSEKLKLEGTLGKMPLKKALEIFQGLGKDPTFVAIFDKIESSHPNVWKNYKAPEKNNDTENSKRQENIDDTESESED